MTDKSEYPKEAGIYKLTCMINGKVYIGKSVSLRRRINQHKNCNTKSIGKFLKKAILKYGWNTFKVEILETVSNFDKLKDNLSLLEREAHYIELYDSTNNDKGYNLCKYSTDLSGIPLTEEHKRNIGNSNRGKIQSEETKERNRQSTLGKLHSNETKDKIRQYRIGRSHSEETKEKIRLARLKKK